MFQIDDKVYDLTFHCPNYTRFGSYSFQEQSPEMDRLSKNAALDLFVAHKSCTSRGRKAGLRDS